jgi:hypothetical protein
MRTNLFDDWQDPWFTVIVTVSTNSKVDLFRVGVGDVSSSKREDSERARWKGIRWGPSVESERDIRIRRSQGDRIPDLSL